MAESKLAVKTVSRQQVIDLTEDDDQANGDVDMSTVSTLSISPTLAPPFIPFHILPRLIPTLSPWLMSGTNPLRHGDDISIPGFASCLLHLYDTKL